MWRDEVRAFSVATRASTASAMIESLHQEGHPAVWYLMLRVGYAITGTNLVLPALALSSALGIAYVVLRFAPFPFWFRLLIVFGTFVSYEYSVMSRNYGIGVLLLVIAATIFRDRSERGIALGIILGLMANTSVHAAIVCSVLSLLWVLDLFDPVRRDSLLRPQPLAGLGIALLGMIIGLWSANPSREMSYATSLHQLTLHDILRSILIDPGKGLKGPADIAASEELPWSHLGIDALIAGRLIVDFVIVSIAWALAPRRGYLFVFVVSVLSFEVLFRGVYPGSLRHQGMLTLLAIGICWIAIRDTTFEKCASFAERIWLGLLPIVLIQSIALPFIARRHLVYPASSSKALAGLIRSNPNLIDAILISEPDIMMEPLPYYVDNGIYMPRQHRYSKTGYFSTGSGLERYMTLGGLINAADSIGCVTRRTIILSIGYPEFVKRTNYRLKGAYNAVEFSWTADEKARLVKRGHLLAYFNRATSDENYETFELPAPDPASCQRFPRNTSG